MHFQIAIDWTTETTENETGLRGDYCIDMSKDWHLQENLHGKLSHSHCVCNPLSNGSEKVLHM